MDVISLGKANKAKKALKKLNDRLGEGVEDIHADVKTRLEEIEKKKPNNILSKRVSALESNTAVNLNKHNIKVNAVLNQQKYKHTEMVFDDFADATGIDATESVNEEYDATNKLVKIATGQTQAEVITVAETSESIPQKITVSFASNEQNMNTVAVDLTSGIFTNTELVDGKIQLKSAIVEPVYEWNQELQFDVLPQEQGWNFAGDANYVSLNNGTLIVNDTGSSYAEFSLGLPDITTESDFTVEFRFKKVNGHEQASRVNIANGSKLYSVTIFTDRVYAGSDIYSIDTTQFHDYRVVKKGSVVKLFIDEIDTGMTFNGATTTSLKQIKFGSSAVSQTGESHYEYMRYNLGEAYEGYKKTVYSSKGNYETPAIDLGDNFKELYKVEGTFTVPEGTEKRVFVSSSTDGISFPDYVEINSDGTIPSSAGRYVKLKVELAASGSTAETIVHNFTEAERSAFQENEFILLDGTAKLKTAYSEAMQADTAFAEAGTLLRNVINKESYRNIEKIRVT